MAYGAEYLGNGRCRFEVWAPTVDRMVLRLRTGTLLDLTMEKDGHSHVLEVEGVRPGMDYLFVLPDGTELADPVSNHQPEGVPGPSRIVDHAAFPWSDGGWKGLPLKEYILYEIHTGAFTPEGTFLGVLDRLPHLKDLGITAVEIMPVAQFPGARNWGYDGVFPFAPQDTYGGPGGLKALVDGCHKAGLAVVLDVVYNHFGPEGNVLPRLGPVFTDRYRTAWGQAVNYDGPGSDGVREMAIQNALYWFERFHVDALRLDAVHAIFDLSARHVLAEMSARVQSLSARLGRPLHLIGESDLNDTKVVASRERGGLGLHAAWSDDFHHSLHALLTGERSGYYEDFGGMADLAKALRQPHVYDGIRSAHRGRRFGNSALGLPGERFVVCAQNHDQVGNRRAGERLAALVPREALGLAAASVLLSPYLPLLFMGEEWGEDNPFLYFADHRDPSLLEAVREGRKAEFSSFDWSAAPPDPFDPETFRRCLLDWDKPRREGHRELLALYRKLIRLRKEHPALASLDPAATRVEFDEELRLLSWERRGGGRRLRCLLNFSDREVAVDDTGGAEEWRTLAGFPSRPGKGYPAGDGGGAAVAVAGTVAPWGFLVQEAG